MSHVHYVSIGLRSLLRFSLSTCQFWVGLECVAPVVVTALLSINEWFFFYSARFESSVRYDFLSDNHGPMATWPRSAYLIIRIIQLVFSAGTVFFS